MDLLNSPSFKTKFYDLQCETLSAQFNLNMYIDFFHLLKNQVLKHFLKDPFYNDRDLNLLSLLLSVYLLDRFSFRRRKGEMIDVGFARKFYYNNLNIESDWRGLYYYDNNYVKQTLDRKKMGEWRKEVFNFSQIAEEVNI